MTFLTSTDMYALKIKDTDKFYSSRPYSFGTIQLTDTYISTAGAKMALRSLRKWLKYNPNMLKEFGVTETTEYEIVEISISEKCQHP